MGERKLFRVAGLAVSEIPSRSSRIERDLQTLFEQHLDSFLGIRFLETEYSTGADHGGRIDTLGLDENNYPVIIEYKRRSDENVLTQILFYYDWLIKHKPDFQLLVQEKLERKIAEQIDWSVVRLLCIAGDFAKYDVHAVRHIDKNIEMLTYRHYGDDMILLEFVTDGVGSKRRDSVRIVGPAEVHLNGDDSVSTEPGGDRGDQYSMTYRLERSDGAMRSLFDSVSERLLALGDDVRRVETKTYFAFKRLRNFACIEIAPTKQVTIFLKLDPKTVDLEDGFTRDMTGKGHQGTGDLEIAVKSEADLEKAGPLLERAYAGT